MELTKDNVDEWVRAVNDAFRGEEVKFSQVMTHPKPMFHKPRVGEFRSTWAHGSTVYIVTSDGTYPIEFDEAWFVGNRVTARVESGSGNRFVREWKLIQ